MNFAKFLRTPLFTEHLRWLLLKILMLQVNADDITPYSCATDIPDVALELKASASRVFRWFRNNYFKVNQGKSHMLLSTKKPETVLTDEVPLAASSHEKMLRVTIDSELKFENHITESCLKVSKMSSSMYQVL